MKRLFKSLSSRYRFCLNFRLSLIAPILKKINLYIMLLEITAGEIQIPMKRLSSVVSVNINRERENEIEENVGDYK